MAMRYYISTEEASFFVNNSMGYAKSVPTTGNYKVGDFIISSTQEDGIFGWVCTVAGTPGEWEVIGSGMSGGGVAGGTRVVGYYNTVEFSDARTSVEIGIEGFDNNSDFLEVHYNGLLLAKDVHYTVSADGLSINAIGEVWNENADDTQSMTFRVLKSEGMKLKKLSNIVDINTSCYDVEIGISGYSRTDILEVHLNGVLLVEGLDYTVENGRLIKVDRSEAWNPYNVVGQKMYIDVFKNIGVVIEPEDGSVTMEKLAPEVAEELEAIDGILDTLSIQTNSLSNLNNRVSELENDNRVGDLFYLNTNDKTDLVTAINEVNVYAHQSVGDIDNLQTTLKGNLVEAINELFISANNGKELIASAIGEPLDASDTFSAMSNDINSLLSQFKTNMMNNGVTVNSSDKFKALIDKIATMVEEGEGKGIQFAEGIETIIVDYTGATFGGVDFREPDTWEPVEQISINVGFKPMYVLLVSEEFQFCQYEGTYYSIPQGYFELNNMSYCNINYTEYGGKMVRNEYWYNDGTSDGSEFIFDRRTEINNTGFDLFYRFLHVWSGYAIQNLHANVPLKWIAIGVGEEDTTLRDSLASILENKGVDVTEEDEMADLISKVDSIKMGDCTNQDLIDALNNIGYKETRDLTLVSLASDNVNMDTSYYSIYPLWGHGRNYPLAILNEYEKYTLGTFKPKINFSNYNKIKLRAATNNGNQTGNILMMTNYVASTGTSSSTSATYRTTVNLTTSVTTYEIDISSWTGEGYLAIEMSPYGNGTSWAFMIDSLELIANDNGLNGNETTEQLLSKLNTLSQSPRLTSGTMVTLDNPCLAIGTSGTYYHTYTHKAPSGTILFSVYINEYKYTTNATVVHKRNGVTLSSTKFVMVEEYDSSYGDYVAVNQYKDYDVQTGDTIEFTFVKGSGASDRIDLALLSADIDW